ncbi:uncharacterized protein BYT42DRAFT_584700 [Radiomyces spectabilis]|uniref:uncharacterized protein n=1 Tax=Radiomyces spectabilis TaxID=64574 RepID=UPI0022212239|nr:uncharacterized protein BYT42DRAFT_584700 [Radiomyces spectabilis]KAI8369503.1 hypothetical protein BYT42DRAFT_584700 [Radiomyces spectabilis]
MFSSLPVDPYSVSPTPTATSQTNMSEERKRDTLVEQFDHAPEAHERLKRVVLISLDKHSADYVFNWAIENFIQPEKDLIILVNVRVVDAPLAPYINPTGFVEELDSGKREESHRLLNEYAHKLHQMNIACKAVAMIGEPKFELVRKATESKADVLIMGSRKMGAVKRTLLGSVSDHCVHNCPCTVVIARPRPDEGKENKRRSIFMRKESSHPATPERGPSPNMINMQQ